MEMRDRSGFDLDGHGQIDRDPIGWQAGFYLSYTDEAHGYGNVGTDDPPAQSPLDSTPEPGSDTPDLNDAAFTAAPARSSFSDAKAKPHVDNYTDPSSASGNWEFGYDCLGFDVTSMSGNADGPATSNGDLTGSVKFTMGNGCGLFDYGYESPSAPANTAPTAHASANPTQARTGDQVTLTGTASTDAETPGNLDYEWDFGNGGATKDASGAVARHTFNQAGTYDVTLLVTDPSGATDTDTVQVVVTGTGGGGGGGGGQATKVLCGSQKVAKTGSWRNVKAAKAPGHSYCDNLGKKKGKDTMTLTFTGPKLDVLIGRATRGGRGALLVDGQRMTGFGFRGSTIKPTFRRHIRLTDLGDGEHTVTLVVTKGRAYVDSFRYGY
jgi:PKD repeat protein